RPVYKAGDTLRFRGIARVPRVPLPLDAPSRLMPAVELPVEVRVESGKTVLFSRAYATGEHGTFHGEVALPLAAARAEASLKVVAGGVEAACAFEVQDYRKTDFRVALTAEPGGLRVEGGYVWGGPVEGAVLRATINGRPAEIVDGRVAAADGDRVQVVLLRDEAELARASATHRRTKEPLPAVDAPAAAAAPVARTPEETTREAGLEVRASKDVYGPGETIEVAIEGAGDAREALVVVADATIYETAAVPLRGGRGTARFAARPIYDPRVAIFAVCGDRQARTDVAVRTQHMPVEVRAPATARPGERVEVTVVGAPRAAFSLAAVDEAVLALREDETPGLYGHFHPARPAGLAVGGFAAPEWDGASLALETPIDPALAREASPADGRLAFDDELVGVGGGAVGRYGSRHGGKRNLVARGGGGGDTNDGVSGGLRGLAKAQSPDGSWGGNAATTGWALLAFMGGGYSHLSKDTYDNVCFGEVIRKGLHWIMRAPEPHDFATALALTEAYGLTASDLFKDAAERAVRWIARGQSADGGWGGIVRSARAVMVLRSAQLSGLPVPSAVAQRAYAYFDARPVGGSRAEIGAAMCALMFLRGEQADPRLARGAAALLGAPPAWADADPAGWYFATLALFQFDGPSGACWKRWQPWIKDVLIRHAAADGTWTVGGERLTATALASLTLQVYYRYANVFGSHTAGEAEESHKVVPPLAPPPRIRVTTPDTAFWAPELVADERGEARVAFALPDAVTTTRLTARGVADAGRVGEAAARIAARPAFFVQLRAPEFACVGDVFEARVDVFAAEPAEAVVRLDGRTQRVRVEPGRPAVTFWTVKAEREGRLVLRTTAEADGRSDGVERVVPVRAQGRESDIVLPLVNKTESQFCYTAPPGVREATLVLRPRRGSLPALLDGLRYLTEYPHGCTEQTLSKFVPNVLTAEALRRLGVDTAAFEADFPAMMRQGVERVLAHQGPAGGWGWYAANPEDPWVTALA
ncbi:MAG TPA: alpha-2-macroglobulin family protein, partial [Planctomycetota bacterium]|nr:alpha-2-macroglobulin family protein [Planctomycetota bacterium]